MPDSEGMSLNEVIVKEPCCAASLCHEDGEINYKDKSKKAIVKDGVETFFVPCTRVSRRNTCRRVIEH